MIKKSNINEFILPGFLANINIDAKIFPSSKYIVIDSSLIDQKSICPICYNLVKKIYQMKTCNHIFCNFRITNGLKLIISAQFAALTLNILNKNRISNFAYFTFI